MNLHATNPALRGGDAAATTYRIKTTHDGEALVFLRKNGDDEVLVIINMSYTSKLKFAIIDERVTGMFKNVFTGENNNLDQQRSLELEAWAYLVLQKSY